MIDHVFGSFKNSKLKIKLPQDPKLAAHLVCVKIFRRMLSVAGKKKKVEFEHGVVHFLVKFVRWHVRISCKGFADSGVDR